jgi:hypothetical protein
MAVPLETTRWPSEAQGPPVDNHYAGLIRTLIEAYMLMQFIVHFNNLIS